MTTLLTTTRQRLLGPGLFCLDQRFFVGGGVDSPHQPLLADGSLQAAT
ncbi:MAG: hypothetical protein GX165_06160 [Firmicutes bacterium]|nr:hypothetical protein [Bacillota bacterium]